MGRRKQPDRQVKKKVEIEMPENLDITKKNRKLEEPGVEAKFKMAKLAPWKQLDRQVKKKIEVCTVESRFKEDFGSDKDLS